MSITRWHRAADTGMSAIDVTDRDDRHAQWMRAPVRGGVGRRSDGLERKYISRAVSVENTLGVSTFIAI